MARPDEQPPEFSKFLDSLPENVRKWFVLYGLPEPVTMPGNREVVNGPFALRTNIQDNSTAISPLTTNAAWVDPRFRQMLNPGAVDNPQITVLVTSVCVAVNPLVAEQDATLQDVFQGLFLGHSRGDFNNRVPLHNHVGHLFTEGVVGTTTADTARWARRSAKTLILDEPFFVNLNTDTFGLYVETAVNTAGAIPTTVTLGGAAMLNAHVPGIAARPFPASPREAARFLAEKLKLRGAGMLEGIAGFRGGHGRGR